MMRKQGITTRAVTVVVALVVGLLGSPGVFESVANATASSAHATPSVAKHRTRTGKRKKTRRHHHRKRKKNNVKECPTGQVLKNGKCETTAAFEEEEKMKQEVEEERTGQTEAPTPQKEKEEELEKEDF